MPVKKCIFGDIPSFAVKDGPRPSLFNSSEHQKLRSAS